MTIVKALLFGFMMLLLIFVLEACGIIGLWGKGLDKESQGYVDEALPAIVVDWNAQEIMNRASPKFMQVTPRSELERLFFTFKQLGKLVEYEGSKGEANVTVGTSQGTLVTAAYVAKAKFENGQATITVRLIKRDEKWKILAFLVNSEGRNQANISGKSQEKPGAEEEKPKRAELEQRVHELMEGDQTTLRREIDKVSSLAALYEEEGNDARAIRLYEEALAVNASNLEYHLRLARLLKKQGKAQAAENKARMVYEIAEDENL